MEGRMSTPNDNNERALIDAMHEARETIEQNTPPRAAHRAETRERVFSHMEERLARGGEDASKINMQRLVLATATLALLIGGAILAWPTERERAPDTPAPPVVAHTPPIPNEPPAPQETALALGLFTKSACESSPRDNLLDVSEGCELTWPEHSGQVTIHAETSLASHERGLHITRGDITFDIDPNRADKRELEIATSGGVIRVIGTRFRVAQDDSGGAVTLERGVIVFASGQGDEIELAPGQTHKWGTHVATVTPKAPTKTPPKRRPRAPKLAPEEIEARVEITMKQLTEIKQLRRLGEFDTASSKLNKLEANAPTKKIAEIISYERGDLLSEHGDAASACKHWRRHQRRYKRGRYASDVTRRRAELGCAR